LELCSFYRVAYDRFMADVFTPQQRSAVMRRVKSANTAPEMRVRRLVHRLGYSYRLHRKDLPGSPDLAFPGRLIALFRPWMFLAPMPRVQRSLSTIEQRRLLAAKIRTKRRS
jgi:DNA mismatch endonuclease (patch repair protein)